MLVKDRILISQHYPHPQEQVWQALTDAKLLAQWLMPNDFLPVVGHKFKFQAPKQPFFDGTVQCEVVTYQPMTKLSYTWQGGPMPKPTLVTFELKADAEGGTVLTLSHTGFSGLFSELIVSRILESGWRKLITKSILIIIEKL